MGCDVVVNWLVVRLSLLRKFLEPFFYLFRASSTLLQRFALRLLVSTRIEVGRLCLCQGSRL